MPGLAGYKQTLAVGQRVLIRARGTTIFVRATNGPLKISPRSTQVGGGDGVEYSVTMEQAEKWFTAEEYDTVAVENIATVISNIELYLGFGDFFRPVPDILNFAFSVPASRSIFTLVDNTAMGQGNANKVSIRPINLTRTRLILGSADTNADVIRIGNTNVDVDQGQQLQAGEALVIQSTDEVFACSEGLTANQAVTIYEENL